MDMIMIIIMIIIMNIC